MSEQGPYNQPPQHPYGGGEYGEGQPPYGQPQGGDPHGGPPGAPNPSHYGTGGQPGYGPPGPGQPMYGGGQPPYGGGPGYTPQPPPSGGGGGSKANLWIIIGGGAIIAVLVVAVIITLISNNRGGESTVAAEDSQTSEDAQDSDESQDSDDSQDSDQSQDDEEPVTPRGEPPFDLPTEPCEAFTDQVYTDFQLTEDGDKSVNDNSSTCRSALADSPDGNSDVYASLYTAYSVPYSNPDSSDDAATEFEEAISDVTAENDYSLYLEDAVEEDEEVDLGDEARFILTGYDYVGEEVPQAVLLVRSENINLRIEYQLSSSLLSDGEMELEDFTMPDDIQDLMVSAGEDALAQIGS